ncbi:MAG: hypothetical protein CMI23_05585 [Opitutae bacterium]|nr:hypothetical protein [Opitutae bacterium]
MRIAFLTSIYPKHAEEIYKQNPKLSKQTSDEQMEFIRWHALSSYVRWFELLEKLGFKTCQFNRNVPEISYAWARENHFNPSSNDPVLEIGKEKIRRFQPNIIFCFAPTLYVGNRFLDEVSGEIKPKVKLIAWYGANVGDENMFNRFDLTLSNSKHLVNRLRKKGISAEWLQHSFDPIILEKISLPNTRKNKMAFFGNLDLATPDFKSRTELLEELTSKNRYFDIFGDSYTPKVKERFKHRTIRYRHSIASKVSKYWKNSKIMNWSNANNLPKSPWLLPTEFAKKINKPKFGNEMLQELCKYQIGFNYHNQFTGNYACNMRLFENTGLGCALLTDNKMDINEYFENEKEVLTYNNKNDAIEKMNFLLNNPDYSKRLGKKAQVKCLSSHNTNKILKILKDYLIKTI